MVATKLAFFINDSEPMRAQKTVPKPSVMSGEFCFQDFHNGLTMHTSNAIEKENASYVTEVPAGISFNFLFDGIINYSLGNQKHCLKSTEGRKASCAFIITKQPEMLTRHLTAGMHIEKLNIFVEKAWLTSRCESSEDYALIDALFQYPEVYQWQPSAEIEHKAASLIQLKKDVSLTGKLQSEQKTMELLTLCLDQARQHIGTTHRSNTTSDYHDETATLKSSLDKAIKHCFSLPEIASALNMSVSTLQRKFKRNYGVNVSNYIKQRRLALAKKSLLESNLSIGEVAFGIGYNHSSNFIKAFKKQFGLTPAAFVKLHKER